MNKRYRKQMRLRSQHYRLGHTRICSCWEFRQEALLAMKRYYDSGRPVPVRKFRSHEPSSR